VEVAAMEISLSQEELNNLPQGAISPEQTSRRSRWYEDSLDHAPRVRGTITKDELQRWIHHDDKSPLISKLLVPTQRNKFSKPEIHWAITSFRLTNGNSIARSKRSRKWLVHPLNAEDEKAELDLRTDRKFVRAATPIVLWGGLFLGLCFVFNLLTHLGLYAVGLEMPSFFHALGYDGGYNAHNSWQGTLGENSGYWEAIPFGMKAMASLFVGTVLPFWAAWCSINLIYERKTNTKEKAV
jgi:hypothetical protein